MRLFDKFMAFTIKELSVQLVSKATNRKFFKNYYRENLQPYTKTVHNFISKGYKIIRLNEKTLAISDHGKRYYLRRYGSDMKVFDQIIINEEYKYLLKLVTKCGLENLPLTIVDCGSNIGLFGAWLLNNAEVKKIISIEADPENYAFQKEIIEKNKYSNKIQLLNRAIWPDSESSLKISSDFRDGQQWAKRVVPSAETLDDTVKSISLNQVFENYLDEEIHILKIDIEGAEKAVFENEAGFDQMLRNTRIIAIEIHEEVKFTSMILSILQRFDFLIESIGETTFAYKKL
jgi:FkbM family methyltransferase